MVQLSETMERRSSRRKEFRQSSYRFKSVRLPIILTREIMQVLITLIHQACIRIGANDARTTLARSCGLSLIVVPIRPPLTYIVSNCSADESITVVNAFFMPRGLHPPRTYPVIAVRSLTWIISTDFSPTERAAALRSTSSAIGMTNT